MKFLTVHGYNPEPTTPLDNRVLPISLGDLKDQLRIEHNDQDRLLLTKIQAATYEIEGYIEAAVIHRGFVLRLPRFPSVTLDDNTSLPVSNPPLISVSSITYLDENGVSQLLDPANYRISRAGLYPTIIPIANTYWPSTFDVDDAVTIEYVAGWASKPSEVPFGLREAILVRAGSRVEMPVENGVGGSVWSIDEDLKVSNLLKPFIFRII